MPRHEQRVVLPYSAHELFAIVEDVKAYPLFVPWCSGAHIQRASGREVIADLVIGFGPFHESFTSNVALDPPRHVSVHATEGPLEHLANTWTFTPDGQKTRVDFVIDFQFKSHLLDHFANEMFSVAATRTVGAFEARAHALYGVHHHVKPAASV